MRIQSISSISRQLRPKLAVGAQGDAQGNTIGQSRFHRLHHQRLDLRKLLVLHFQHQFIVYLQYHRGIVHFPRQSIMKIDHRLLKNISSSALNGHVNRGAFLGSGAAAIFRWI